VSVLSHEDLKDMYRKMVLIRVFEERMVEQKEKGLISGFVHVGIGQEATQVGIWKAMRKGDYLFPDHRCHGLSMINGIPGERIMAEYLGRATGMSKGKGHHHFADVAHGNMGKFGIQGANQVLCLGTAFSAQYRGLDSATVVVFGDGTVGRGEFHEGLNLAAIWRLPVVYVCVNNLYAMSTPAKDAYNVEDLATFSVGYGIPGMIADGNDVVDVYGTMSRALLRARRGDGPSLVEMKTYRWQGSFHGDPISQRPEDEVEAWKKRCPIKRFAEELLKKEIITKSWLDEIYAEETAKVDDMLEFSLDSPVPSPKTVMTDLYYGRDFDHIKEQMRAKEAARL
jgi:TPP-dependent pyruvate/acetoin dehydrogenase alpha subunit